MERSELLERLREDISWLGSCETERQIISHIKYAMKFLKEQPDIVRCKDCKHQNWVNAETGNIVCKFGRGANPPDWFCADGERRADG